MNSNLIVTTLEIAGLIPVLKALRLPFGKECRSKVEEGGVFDLYVDNWADEYWRAYIDPKDVKLISDLVVSGDEHAKVIRGLIVYAKITAPRYWWVEMDTYIVGTQRLSSESTMHIQARGLKGDELVEYKNNVKEGIMQTRIQYFSYQALRRIYFQRRNHRLPHWQLFCKWVEDLPFAKEWIIVDRNKEKDTE